MLSKYDKGYRFPRYEIQSTTSRYLNISGRSCQPSYNSSRIDSKYSSSIIPSKDESYYSYLPTMALKPIKSRPADSNYNNYHGVTKPITRPYNTRSRASVLTAVAGSSSTLLSSTTRWPLSVSSTLPRRSSYSRLRSPVIPDSSSSTDYSKTGASSPRASVYCSSYLSNSPLGRDYMVRKRSKELEETRRSCEEKILVINRRIGSKHSAGIINVGSSCYMNAVLQCLYHSSQFIGYILKRQYEGRVIAKSDSLFEEFGRVGVKIWSSYDAINVSTFKARFVKDETYFARGQQDAHEYLILLLTKLSEDLRRLPLKPTLNANFDGLNEVSYGIRYWDQFRNNNDHVIGDWFMGLFRSTLKCTICLNKKINFEPFSVITLSIKSSGSYTLQEALDAYVREESFTEFKCDRCGRKRHSIKTIEFYKLPKYLIIHFNRFTVVAGKPMKAHTAISYPRRAFDLTPYTLDALPNQVCTYNLYGAIIHSGDINFGHYTAICRQPRTGDWYTYNDDKVTRLDAEDAVNKDAYILFYETFNDSDRSLY